MSGGGAAADEGALLPAVEGSAAYRALRDVSTTWLPAMRVICGRHGLPVHELEALPAGTNVVFAVGDAIVKLYPPHWARLADVERAVAERVRGKLPVATPEVYATGTVAGWPYLVMSRLRGRSLHEVLASLDEREQGRIAAQLGEVLSHLHREATTDLDDLESDWPGFVQERLRDCVNRHREQGAPERWLTQLPRFLTDAAPLFPPDFRPSIVSGDVHDYHLLVTERRDRWQLAGLFDFDDARIGFHEYDLATPGPFMMAGREALLRTFLLAYGYPRSALDQRLSRRLLAYTLLHRYRPLAWLLEDIAPGAHSTLEGLAEAIFAVAPTHRSGTHGGPNRA